MNRSVGISLIVAIVAVGGGLAYFASTDTSEKQADIVVKPTGDVIKIAINQWPGHSFAFIAQEKGFFEKNGVNVELVLDERYSVSQQRFVSNEVDGLFEVIADTVFRNARENLAKVVYVDVINDGDVIVGSVDSVSELKGKTIGVGTVSSFSYLLALKTLESNGLDEGDIFIQIVSAQDVVNRLDNGNIQAGVTWEPTKSLAVEKGYKILSTSGDYPYLLSNVLSFDVNIIKERPDDIRNIVKSFFEARDFLETNPDEAISIMSESVGIPENVIRDGISAVWFPDLEENSRVMDPSIDPALKNIIDDMIEFYTERGRISQTLTFEDIVEPKFVQELIN